MDRPAHLGAMKSWAVLIAAVAAGAASLLLAGRMLRIGPLSSTEVIAPGTALIVRLAQPLSAQSVRLGDVFEAWVVSATAVKGTSSIPPGARVEGRCVAARQGEGDNRPGYLRLALSGLRDSQGRFFPLETTTVSLWENMTGFGSNPAQPTGTVRGAAEVPAQLSAGTGVNSGVAAVRAEGLLTFVLLKPAVVAGHRWDP